MEKLVIDIFKLGMAIILAIIVTLIFGDSIISKLFAILTGIGMGVIIIEMIRDTKKKENVK